MNKVQLGKELRFIHSVFAHAADSCSKIGPDDVIVAGGACRDAFFGRDCRDLDLYYNSTAIDNKKFASALMLMDISGMARASGFTDVTIIRKSDNLVLGRTSKWSSISDDDRNVLDLFVEHLLHQQIFHKLDQALILAHGAVPDANPILIRGSIYNTYVREQLAAASSNMRSISSKSSNGNSGGGSKVGKSHALQSVEEYTAMVDGMTFDVELMAVSDNPIDYITENFALNISKAYYNGKVIRFTREFMNDASSKTLTVSCRAENARFDRLFTYYLPKIQSYFPDFDVRVDLAAINR